MHRIFLFLFLLSQSLSAQLIERWDKNSFTTPPLWQGQVDKYTINTAQQKVLLNATAENSDAYISTTSEAFNDASWEFSVYMDFNPSSTNYTNVFLSANQADYNDNLQGYYVMIGNTEDEVSLWKREAGSNVKIIDGRDKILDNATVAVSIKAQRDHLGNWQLQTKLLGQDYITEGMVKDNSLAGSKYFGIYCRYTSTRSNKFSFGPITVSGNAYVDTSKPRILAHQFISGKKLDIVLSKAPDAHNLSTTNFTLKPGNIKPERIETENNTIYLYFKDYVPDTNRGEIKLTNIQDEWGNTLNDTTLTYSFQRIKILNTTVINPTQIELNFNKKLHSSVIGNALVESELDFSLPSRTNDSTLVLNCLIPMIANRDYALKITGVESALGDIIKDSILHLNYRAAERFDIVFTELMPDENPNVGLYDSEFVEIYNRRDYPINLKGMKLAINNKATLLPNYELASNGYVVLINQNQSEAWPTHLPVLGIKNLPALANTAGTLILYHANNIASDVIQYPLPIKEGGFKKEGGWSFERLDMNNNQAENNWAYATHLDGGTPGAVNSVKSINPDTKPPYICYLSYVDARTFEIAFSEGLSTNAFTSSSVQVEGASVADIVVEPIFLNKLTISLSKNLATGQIYKASFTDEITDFSGNAMDNNNLENQHSLRLGVPQELDSFDVCMNEILFNPAPNDVDFVELFNRSSKILNRNDIYLSSISDPTSDILFLDALKQIDDKNRLFFPNDYLVITSDVKQTKNMHPEVKNEMLNQSTLPSMNDDKGSIAITKKTGEIVDYFVYDSKMHFELLRDKEGVSLERMNANAVTNNLNNWHSASQQSGYATPTQQNSQYSVYAPRENTDWLWIDKEEFSPNTDGSDDVLLINYKLDEPGWTGTICIYNRYGQMIKTLANNELLGTEGFFSWDGTNQNRQATAIGIYIVYADLFSTSGKRKQQKITAVLTAGQKW